MMNPAVLAEELYQLAIKVESGLLNDVELAKTREEHVRLTARANEAGKVRDGLQRLVALAHDKNTSE
jgi:hypothetical protein